MSSPVALSPAAGASAAGVDQSTFSKDAVTAAAM